MTRITLLSMALALSALVACAGDTALDPPAQPDGSIGFVDNGVGSDQQVLPLPNRDVGVPPDTALPQTADTGPAPGVDQGGPTTPICNPQSADGVPLNPGCDVDVQAGHISALGSASTGSDDGWLLVSGKKWWFYRITAGQPSGFSSAGADIAALFRAVSPGCDVRTSDGIHLNPGCDPDVQASGVDALGGVTDADGNSTWMIGKGRKWWIYGAPAGGTPAFSSGGSDTAVLLRSFAPDCGAMTNDNIPLNPGCDSVVQNSGLGAVGAVIENESQTWLAIQGRRWWVRSHSGTHPPTFVDGGADVSTWLRGSQPACGTQSADGTELNPGCDADVQAGGLDAVGSTLGAEGVSSWLAIRGKKWWTYRSDEGFTAGGSDFAAWLRDLPVVAP